MLDWISISPACQPESTLGLSEIALFCRLPPSGSF